MFQTGISPVSLPSRSRSSRNCASAKTCLRLFTGSMLLAPVCTHYGLPCSQPIDGRNHILGPVVTAGSAEGVDEGMQVFNKEGCKVLIRMGFLIEMVASCGCGRRQFTSAMFLTWVLPRGVGRQMHF